MDLPKTSNNKAGRTGHLGRFVKAKQEGFTGNFNDFRKSFPSNYKGGKKG